MLCTGVSSRELKQRIKPEMIELIKQQRLNHLVNGTRFSVKLGRRSGLLINYHLYTVQSTAASLVYNSTGVHFVNISYRFMLDSYQLYSF